MRRVIARVPPEWRHPIETVDGRRRLVEFVPRSYDAEAAAWDAGKAEWENGTHRAVGRAASFVEWEGDRPTPEWYAPWSAEEATWLQVWNTIGEGHPVSPAFPALDELRRHMVTVGEDYAHLAGLGPPPSGPWDPADVDFLIRLHHTVRETSEALET